ncbi:MAG TPA: hypothetical protein VFP94_00045, partial [Terriglobales bacterium]|nr:hypothetical protein [Terriglobales bacterium]
MRCIRKSTCPALTLALTLLAFTAARGQSAPPPCFAYLHGGDLWFQCGGRPIQVTHTARIGGFALAGPDLVLENDYGTTRLYLVAKGRLLRTLPNPRNSYWLWTSCGKLWAQDNGGGKPAALPGGEAPSAIPCMGAIPPSAQPHDYRISPNGQYLAFTKSFANRPYYT